MDRSASRDESRVLARPIAGWFGDAYGQTAGRPHSPAPAKAPLSLSRWSSTSAATSRRTSVLPSTRIEADIAIFCREVQGPPDGLLPAPDGKAVQGAGQLGLVPYDDLARFATALRRTALDEDLRRAVQSTDGCSDGVCPVAPG